MGGLLSADLGLLSYEHWMPDEDPTFYIPASLSLTYEQRVQLEASGLRQGEPFILTNDGAFTKPSSKKFSLRGIKSSFSIRRGSLLLFEEAPGSFSLEFSYYNEEPVILEIHTCAINGSSMKHIKLKQSATKWGPFRLNSCNQKSTRSEGSHQPAVRRPSRVTFKNDSHQYQLTDVTELDDAEFKPDDPAAEPSLSPPTATSTVQSTMDAAADGIINYTKWSSRKFQHKQLSAPLSLISLQQLPSLSPPPAGNNGPFDIVIIVTSAEHVAARMQNRKNSDTKIHNFNITSTNISSTNAVQPHVSPINASNVTSTTQARSMRDTHRTHSTWLSRQSPRKIMPTRAHSTNTVISSMNSSGGGNHAYAGIPPVDLAENPHTEAYQREHSTALDINSDVTISNSVEDGRSSPTKGVARAQSRRSTVSGGTGRVEREAFFFRINQESYSKRHTTNTTPSSLQPSTMAQSNPNAMDSPSPEAGAKEKARKQPRNRGRSEDIERSSSMVPIDKSLTNSASEPVLEESVSMRAAENATSTVKVLPTRTPSTRGTHRRGIFMRSKGITLDLCMQLFQVPTGVYNRLTLYGMENFIPQSSAVSGDSENTTDARSVPNTSADARIHNTGSINADNAASTATSPANADSSAECIICLTNKQNTIMFPCRHLCLCAECASILATQAGNMGLNRDHQPEAQEKKCPVCRKPVIVMFQLKA